MTELEVDKIRRELEKKDRAAGKTCNNIENATQTKEASRKK